MADSSNHQVSFRRRREKKTDYDQRLELLKSGKPRAVVRLSNRHTRVQISLFDTDGDNSKAQTVSKQLEEYGWEHGTGNLPAAYLTGYLAGTKTGVDEAVLDKGLRRLKSGSRMMAAVKGLKDAGVDVPAGEEMMPEESRLRGEHIKEMRDENVPENLEDVKSNIEDDLNG